MSNNEAEEAIYVVSFILRLLGYIDKIQLAKFKLLIGRTSSMDFVSTILFSN